MRKCDKFNNHDLVLAYVALNLYYSHIIVYIDLKLAVVKIE